MTGHYHLEMFKGFLFFDILVPGLVRMSEIEEGSGYNWEIPDEATVEVNKAYESLDVSLVFWGGPVADSSDFNRVYCNLVLWDDQSEVFNLLLMELTLLQTEE